MGNERISAFHVCTTARNLPLKEAEYGKSHIFQESFFGFIVDAICNDVTWVALLLTDYIYCNCSCSLYIRVCKLINNLSNYRMCDNIASGIMKLGKSINTEQLRM